jgi:hypothetical protein
MNYAVMIAAAFILATIAVATLSPFHNLPQGAPQESVAAAPPSPDESSSPDDSSSTLPSSAQDGSSNNIKWPPGEEPPQ